MKHDQRYLEETPNALILVDVTVRMSVVPGELHDIRIKRGQFQTQICHVERVDVGRPGI